MTGDQNGNFNPAANVTRNEMAVVMSNLMDYTVSTYKGTSPFTDVPDWAEPYVAACYTNGIIAGYSDTTLRRQRPRHHRAGRSDAAQGPWAISRSPATSVRTGWSPPPSRALWPSCSTAWTPAPPIP